MESQPPRSLMDAQPLPFETLVTHAGTLAAPTDGSAIASPPRQGRLSEPAAGPLHAGRASWSSISSMGTAGPLVTSPFAAGVSTTSPPAARSSDSWSSLPAQPAQRRVSSPADYPAVFRTHEQSWPLTPEGAGVRPEAGGPGGSASNINIAAAYPPVAASDGSGTTAGTAGVGGSGGGGDSSSPDTAPRDASISNIDQARGSGVPLQLPTQPAPPTLPAHYQSAAAPADQRGWSSWLNPAAWLRPAPPSVTTATGSVSSQQPRRSPPPPLSAAAAAAGPPRVLWNPRTPPRPTRTVFSPFATLLVLAYLAAAGYYFYVRVAFSLDMGRQTWYGALILAIELLGLTSVLPYALLLPVATLPSGSRGLPVDDGRALLPPEKRFRVHILVPCYKVRHTTTQDSSCSRHDCGNDSCNDSVNHRVFLLPGFEVLLQAVAPVR